MGEDGLGDLDGKSFEELYQYFRSMYQQVAEDSLAEWERKYPGSTMEQEDLKDYYNKYKGSMTKVKDFIPFVEDEDLWRIKEVLDGMIESGEIEVVVESLFRCPALFLHCLPRAQHEACMACCAGATAP